MKKNPRLRKSIAALLASMFLCTTMFLGGATVMLFREGKLIPPPVALTLFPTFVSNPQVEAKAAIVYDPQDGRVLYAKNAQAQLPLASITKLMTAEIVLTAVAPDTLVRITPRALLPFGDWGFKKGDIVPLSTLLKIGLIASSNDAMQAAAESLGTNYLARMNEVAHNLGLIHTTFANPTGLDVDSTTSGAYSSAYDVARLATLFYSQYPSFFEMTQQNSVSIDVGGRTLTAHATDEPLLDIPGLIGAKTGYTDLAGGNLVAIFDVEIGHPLVAVVLGSTKEGRFNDIHTLISAARKQ